MDIDCEYLKYPRKGWIQTKLGNIASWGSGGTPLRKTKSYFEGQIPWIKTGELTRKIILDTEEKISEEGLYNSSAKIFPKGSVAIAMYGATIGKTSILGIDAATNQACAVAQVDSNYVHNVFLYYFLLSQTRSFIRLGKGGAQPNISQTILKEYDIPIPPLPEQHRIVAKIEELDQGIESLKVAQKQLKIYRQAVLKWAFEGKLTAEWRERQRKAGKLENAKILLEKIQQERENRYQQQLEEWKESFKAWEANGKVGKKPGKPKRLRDLPTLTTDQISNLPEIPINWLYTYLVYGGVLARGKSKHRPRNDHRLFGGKYPFIQTGEVKSARGVLKTFNRTYNEFGLSQSRLWEKGTLCITIAANIADTCFLGIDACFPDSIVGFTSFESIVNAHYVDYFIQSTKDKIEYYAPATAQKNINLTILENLVIPFCSLIEQNQIVQEIESRLSICDSLEVTIKDNLAKSEALRQSILKRAFEGKLVPQDPNDEPAEKLLERIRQEKFQFKQQTKQLELELQ
jgi:type I restriction enzyme, S subunit